jgi:aerobic carbon-monoxide dehydrogenase medium subunit
MYSTRRMPAVEYLAPKTLKQACTLLSRYKGEARVLAGGTDLVPDLKMRHFKVGYLIGLKNIKGLDKIKYTSGKGLTIGALAVLSEIAQAKIVKEKYPLLAQAIRTMASPQIRNMGTLVGNLCKASPSADTAPSLLVMEASLKLVGVSGERVVPLKDFFKGPSKTLLQDDEIVTEVQIPELPAKTAGVYMKHTRRGAMDLAIVGVAALVTMDGDTCQEAKIAVGASAPTPFRATQAEKAIRGKILKEALVTESAELASKECRPISDIRSSADYRKEMVKVYTRRALTQACELAKQYA